MIEPQHDYRIYATYEELEREALHDAALFTFLTHYRRGDCTKEEALVSACLYMSRDRRRMMSAEVERLMNQKGPGG